MDSRAGQSGPYRASGDTAAARAGEASMSAGFAAILTPEALTARAEQVERRGRRQRVAGAVLAAVGLMAACVLVAWAGATFDGSLEGMVASNFMLVGALLALGGAYASWAVSGAGSQLVQTAADLRARAEHDRRTGEGRR
ncbi:MAG: hypothetical protein HS108_04945 [Planctomycetes bacterium]|nr:hypothetical protein [Planctomycetota bacterium]